MIFVITHAPFCRKMQKRELQIVLHRSVLWDSFTEQNTPPHKHLRGEKPYQASPMCQTITNDFMFLSHTILPREIFSPFIAHEPRIPYLI